MNTNTDKIQQLEKQLVYYKKQVDILSGNALSSQYAFTQLSNVCKKYINGFQIIADIQRSFSFYSSRDKLYEQFAESILSQMFLDRVILLEVNNGKKELKPILWKGFGTDESLLLANTILDLPEDFLQDKKSILVSSESLATKFGELLQSSLLTPHFILTPLIKNQQVWGALFVGMQGINLISYIPLSKSNIDMFESLAGMISAMTQQLEQREVMEKERNRIARDMHDDIGSELSKISITCEHIKSRINTEVGIINDLDIIKESTGAIVNNIGNIIWALNPINNTLDGLLGYLREYAFEYLEMHQLEVVFNFPETSENQVISHEARTHIFMVVKEALHNIIKHAVATVVEINISVSQNKLTCFISDNGVGLSVTKNSRFGNGLRNMKQRIIETGGDLIIHSEPGKGTTLEFEVTI
jgi:signal transduction histidine kinase